MFFAGFVLFRGDVGHIESDEYYHSISRSRLYSAGTGKAVVNDFEAPGELGNRVGHRHENSENSEARQREALEIADRILHNQHSQSPAAQAQQAKLGELIAGGGSVTSNPADHVVTLPGGGGADADQAQLNAQQQLHDPTNSNIMPESTRRATATISQVFSNGEVRELVVDAARVSFLDVMSDGIESQDLEGGGPDHEGWWSDTISPDGKKVKHVDRPTLRPTAALATAQSLTAAVESGDGVDEGQCKIAVLDVAEDLAHSINARPCELKFKRVWPFSRHKFGIDGVETLYPEDYQYSQEHWVSQSIRNSSRFTTNIDEADFVFVDMWCYHIEWLSYIHPLGNRNSTNPEPYVRRSLNAIVKMDRWV